MVITFGFAGGFTGGYFASRGDPFWTVSGGLAGVIGVSAGADVYAPTLAYLLSMATAALVVWAGAWLEKKMRVDDVVGAVAVHGVAGFLGMFWVGVFAAGYPTGLNNVDSSIGGQLMGMATFLPLGFLTGWFASFVLRKLNLLDRKSTRLNSSHANISYAVFCLKKKKNNYNTSLPYERQ